MEHLTRHIHVCTKAFERLVSLEGRNGMKIDFCKASVITMTDPIRGNEVLGVA